MTTPPLTVRNLTSTPLRLKQIERYEAVTTPRVQGGFSHFTRNITSIRSNFTTTPIPQLDANAPRFERQDVDILVEPFERSTTNIYGTQRTPNDTLRLTFEAPQGQKYRIEVPTPSPASQSLIPLTQNPTFQYTGIFDPALTHLTLLSSSHLSTWMSNLPSTLPLSALSIPGTHNSPTYHRALPSVRCQAVSPLTQLENGIRFFDIRVQPSDPTSSTNSSLLLVHGIFPISLTGPKPFRPLVAHILSFLAAHPSETLILSLKREGPGSATDAQLSQILHTHYVAPDPSKWYTDPRIPSLGAARGKIVLMRRFALDTALAERYAHQGGWCIDAENWAYNTPHDTHGAVCVQDFCEVLEAVNIDSKIAFCEQHLERAAACVAPIPGVTTDAADPVPPGPLYLNFLSASNFWRVGCWPERIAGRVNGEVVRFLCERFCVEGTEGEKEEMGVRIKGDGGTGIVVCDWVGKDGDWDLVRCIVGMNARLLVREVARGG